MAQEIEKVARMALLVDFYGQLLTEKQRQAMELYYGDDLSLGEIAESLDISRQAVHDLVKRSGKILEEYEANLGLVQKHLSLKQGLESVNQALAQYRIEKNEILLYRAENIIHELLKTF
ncbi:MAG: putative DNA-binding protein [Clostridia bacterium]|nr:putative DNA-binding protein [Clostridia bacterium]